jgi:hypothetical protein
VADRIRWYDILGVAAGASVETVQFAYQAKPKLLQDYRIAAAPSAVALAAVRGQKAVDAAWLILGDRAQRERYDEQIGVARPGAGLGPEPAASRARSGMLDAAADALYAAGVDLDFDVLEGLGVLSGLLAAIPAPRHRADRKPVTVPDVRVLFFRACQDALTMAGFRVRAVRLTANPMPVEGLVVGQSPVAGQIVPRSSALTVEVWHPPCQPAHGQ